MSWSPFFGCSPKRIPKLRLSEPGFREKTLRQSRCRVALAEVLFQFSTPTSALLSPKSEPALAENELYAPHPLIRVKESAK